MDYLIDVMRMSASALISGRFSCGLYDHLLRVRTTPMMDVRITSATSSDGQIQARLAYDGCYIDRGESLHGRRVLVQVSERGGLSDLRQRVCYRYSDGSWRFYVVRNSGNGHYSMLSTQTGDDRLQRLDWIMTNG